jgi:drug/metabolite transporter (DMT)-like permease
MRSRETLGLLLGFVGVVIFGATLPMTRIAVPYLDPVFLTAGRAAVAGLVAVAVLVALRRPLPPLAAVPRIALASLLLVGGFPVFSGFAMLTVPASHGAVVIGIMPLATAMLGALLLRERPSPAFWLAAVIGSAIIVVFSLRDGGGRIQPGDLLLVGAIASASLGYVISAGLSRSMPGWEVISWAVVIALPVSIPLAWATAPADAAAVPAVAWAAFAYLGLMSQYLGFFAWNAGLAMGGVSRVSQVQLLQTFVTFGIAALVSGERVDVWTWLAAVAVCAVVLVGRRARIRKQ